MLNLRLGAVRAPKPLVTVVGVGSVGAATVAAYGALWEYLHQPYQGDHRTVFHLDLGR